MNKADDSQLPLFEFDSGDWPDPSPLPFEPSGEATSFSKYIVYVDESGDHSLQSIDENYPIFG
ncbi:MAG: hypothetical protein RLN85_14550 [Pseudomonadales bacterium]